MTFTCRYLAALEQPYPSELIDQAAEVAADFPEDAFVDWPLNCLDGQFAGALSLASNDMVSSWWRKQSLVALMSPDM